MTTMRCALGLLLVSLCAACATTAPPSAAVSDEEMGAGEKILHWIPNVVLDLYDVPDVNLGTETNDYPFGMHLKATKFLRVGAFDTADFELFGLNALAHGEEDPFDCDARHGGLKVGAQLGLGAGARMHMDLYEVYDLLAGLVTLNLYNPAGDHTSHMAGAEPAAAP